MNSESACVCRVMLIAKLGELEGMQELDFVRKRFMLDLDDKQAADEYARVICVFCSSVFCSRNF